jgi:CxxC-x17-CxxC domain-containing protein
MYDAICATCGRPTSVPFIPREDRPVYCNDCFQAQRASRPPRREESQSYSMSYSNGDSGFGGGRSRDYRDRRDNSGFGGGRGRDHGNSGGRGRDRRDGGRRERHDRWEERW